jgi:hypothetical protein
MARSKKRGNMDSFLAGLKEKRIIDTSNSNGLLAAFWLRILSRLHYVTEEDRRRIAAGERVSTSLDGNRWGRLVDAWEDALSRRQGRDSASNKRGNLIPALMQPTLTWGSLISGLNILNSTKFFKQVRLEVKFVNADDDSEQVIGIDLYNRDAEKKEDPYVTFAKQHKVPILRPGDVVKPMKNYIPEGFNNEAFSNIVLNYTGTQPMKTHPDTFLRHSYVDAMVLDGAGMCSTDWVRIVGKGKEQ